ncbi:MAG: hypothetical protein MUC97_04805 [Bernardetiaceae bacterium]|jgi:hypothetical protein|nr:hypothetical protein [Bernardetiaceae bacterium]
MKQILLLLLAYLSLAVSAAQAQAPPLERTVTLRADNLPVSEVLDRVAQQAGFTFAYNPQQINVARPTNLNAQGRTVRQVLNALFQGTVEYRARGEYVILTRAPEPTAAQARPPEDYLVTGYVMDEATGAKLPNVSLYDRASLAATLTDAYGFYRIRLPANRGAVSLTVIKQGYLAQNFTLQPPSDAYREVNLVPLPDQQLVVQPQTLATNPPDTLSLDNQPLLKVLVPTRQRLHALNLLDTVLRGMQLSLVPAVGTNRLLGGRATNNLSINLLGGYSEEITGLEMGGVFNIVRGNVRYVQLAGVFNMVGGNVRAWQAAGLGNLNYRDASGLMMGGLFNLQRGRAVGMQAAGGLNLTWGHARGIQMAGMFNFNRDTLQGYQAAGLFNVAWRQIKGVQTAGLFNVAGEVKGAQISPLLNVSTRRLGGLQLGLVNYATKMRGGIQLGLVNYADSSRHSLQMGLFSFVRRGGYKRLEVSANDLTNLNVTVRSGVNGFYNLITLGQRTASAGTTICMGYGVGSGLPLGKSWMINLEATGHWFFTDDFHLGEVNNQLYKFALLGEYKISKHFSVAAGPTANLAILQDANFTALSSLIPYYQYDYEFSRGQIIAWTGFHLGLRFF